MPEEEEGGEVRNDWGDQDLERIEQQAKELGQKTFLQNWAQLVK